MLVKKNLSLLIFAALVLIVGLFPGAVSAQNVQPTTTPTPVASQSVPYSDLIKDAIPFGHPLALKSESGQEFTLWINKAYVDEEAARMLGNPQTPADRRWVVIQVSVLYQKGPTDYGASLLDESQFDIVSRGHILSDDYFKYTPSPTLDQIHLFPEKKGLGYLVYQFDRSEPQPLLRLVYNGQTYFLKLFNGYMSNVLKEQAGKTEINQVTPQLVNFSDQNVGTKENPIPPGTSVAYQFNQSNLKVEINVRKILRGYDAYKESNDVWGVVGTPENGLEYIMPYFEIKVTGTDTQIATFDNSTLWKVISGDEEVPMNSFTFFCPMPCLQEEQAYLGGAIEGWLPRLVKQGDPNPLLVFDDRLYFSLTTPATSADSSAADAAPQVFSANALSYDNVNNIQVEKELNQGSVVRALDFSADGKLLASGSEDRKIHIWNIDSGTEATSFDADKIAINDLDFSPDGKWIAAVDIDNRIAVFDASSGKVVKELDQKGKGIFGKFLPDGSLVTVNRNGTITTWDPTTGEVIHRSATPRHAIPEVCVDSYLYHFAMTDDGSVYAASLSCGYGVAWEPASTRILSTIEDRRIDAPVVPGVSAVALSSRRNTFAFGPDWRHEGDLWLIDVADLDKGLVINSVGSMQPEISLLAFSPEGSLLASGLGNVVRVFWPEIPSGYMAGQGFVDLTAHDAQITSLEFSPDATRMATGDYLGKIVFWSVPQK
jgi:WD40 repeat protein